MEHKNSMSRVERLHREKVTRYSIRKYSFGAASVAVAALFMFLGNGAVSANELSKQDTPSVEASAKATEDKTTSEEATAKPAEATTPTLDKSELTNLISEIETKLSNGSYDNKTEESVAVLKADLEAAKATLANATTQAELKKAYSKLVTTANTKLKNKPVEKKETPAVDTTNGKETVGKKAENTEKKSESNSIENTGSKDSRNGKVLDKDNAFRAETTATQGNFTYSMEYSNGKEIYLYNEEDADVNITVNSTAGKIKRATVKAGSGQFTLSSKSKQAIAYAKGQSSYNPPEEEVEIDDFGWSYHQIITETQGPVTIKITGKPNDTFKALTPYTKTEDQRAVLGARYLELEDSTGAKLPGGRNASSPGYFNLVVKSQTYKYDIQPVAEGDKVAVADINNLTAPDITKIKEKIKIQYSDKATKEDARLASHKGEVLADKSSVVKEIGVSNGTVTVTYNDDSVDTTPVASVARTNAAPTVEIPFSVEGKKDIYVYANEDIDVDLKYNDDSGKIKFATIKQGGNKALSPVDSVEPNIINNEYNTQFTQINAETATPAIVKITGKMTKETPGLTASKFPTDENGEYRIVTRYATATDLDDAIIENTAVGNSYATDPGAFTLVLKAQTRKYDIKAPETKVPVVDANNVTDAEFNEIKKNIKIQYSTENPDKNLADKKGTEVENQDDRIESITKDGNNVVVTYKDGSKDSKPLTDFARTNPAPTVELPYSNEAKKQIYVYTGENTDLTFKGTDDNEVKNLYLRGPGDVSWNNTTGYGLPTGKVENGAVTGEGSISDDKRTATIKMTGVTNLSAGQKWTSFVVANDNDNAASASDFRALDKNPNATQTPGYVQFIVKNQTSKYDIATPTEKVAVADPANVTEDDLAKIKEKLQLEYNKKNDDANISKDSPVTDKDSKIKSLTKDADGNLVVTYTDGSTDKKPLSEFVTLDKQPAIDEVNKAAEKQIEAINNNPEATQEEKDAAITKVNADKKKALDEIAKPEVTTKDALDKAQNAGTDAIAKDNPVVAKKDEAKKAIDGALTAKNQEIDARTDLTPEEKTKAKEAAKAAADKAKEAVDAATTNADVDTAAGKIGDELNKVNPVAKAAAKKAIADELSEKEKAIDARTDLTKEEKDAAKKEAQDKAKEATDAINAQPDNAETPEKAAEAQTAVDGAKDKGVADVKAVNPVAAKKAEAKQAIDDALTAKNQEIDARTDLTPEEKTKAKELAKAQADVAKGAVDAATTNAAVDKAKADGTTAVANVTPVAKAEAKKAIAKALEDKNSEIDKRTDLTDEEKTAAKNEAKDKADAQLAKINEQPDAATTPTAAKTAQDAVDAAKKTGVDEVTAVNPVAVKKPAAKKAIDDALKAKEAAIDARTDLTDDEKKAAKDAAKDAADKAKAAVDAATTDAAVDTAKGTGTGDIAKVNPVAKEAAKKAVADELAKKEAEIDGRKDLTDEEKAAAKKEAQDKAKAATDAINAQPSNAETPEKAAEAQKAVDTAKKSGVDEVAAVNPEAVSKPAAKKAIDDALKAKEDAIDARTDLTDDEKKAAKDAAKDAADKAKAAVDAAPSNAEVEKAKEAGTGEIAKVNPVAKEAAKKAVADELANKEAEIAGRNDLTDEEKAKAKEEAQAKAKEATDAIDAQPSNAETPEKAAEAQTAVDGAKDKGVADVKAVNPEAKAKPEAKQAIDDALKAKEDAIDARTDLTDDEKKAAKDAAKEAADKAKAAVDAATTDAEVEKAKEAGTGEIAKVNPVAKEAAKKAIADELAKKEEEIASRNDLTDEEKAKAKEEAQAKAKEATDAIDAQPSNAETPEKAAEAQTAVDGAKDKGVADVKAVNPEAVSKPEAKQAIDDALKAKEDAIDARTDLTDDEKKAAKDAAKEAADKAKAAVDAATTDAEVEKAKEAGTGEIAKVNPVAKEVAKKAIADELAKKEEEIAGRNDLTDEEKAKAKEEAQAKAKEATDAIDAQPSNAETPEKAAEAQTAVDGAKDKGVADVKAVNPEAVTKPAAKKAIEDKLAKQLEDIANTPDATDEEKKVAADAAKDLADKAKEEIDKAGTDAEVKQLQEEAEGEIEKSVPVVEDKPNARKAIEDEATAKKAEIDARTDFSPKAKEVLKAKVDKVAEKAKAAIDAVSSVDDVNTIEEADKTAIKAIGEVNRPIDKVLVKDPSALTDEEKAKILEEVKKVNPTAKEVKYDENGNIEVTTEAGDKGIIDPTKLVKTEDQLDNGKGGNDINKPLDKVIVKDPSNLTDEEKAKIVAKVEEVNPDAIVTIDENGTVSVSTLDGKTSAIPASELVRTKEDTAKPDAGNSKIVKPADKVAGEANDPDDQAKAEEKLRELNPETKSVKFDENGNATVTLKDGTTATIPSEDLFKSEADVTKPNAGNDIVKPADKTVVANPEKLTDAEKKAIEDKVKAVNPDATVVVDDKGNATVTTPEGKTAVIPSTDLTKDPEAAAKPNAGNDIVKPADKTVVANPEKLTDAEKKAIEDKVKAVNPDATVVVDDKGNATVTTPEGKTAVIPAADLTKDPESATKPNAGNDIVKPADKTVVANPEKLTDAEKKAIEDKVKAVNPDATVVVDDKGNATVTTPEGKTAVIPAADLTKDPESATKPNAGNDIVKPADKTVVANPEKLTDAEKKAIEDKVKAVNPDATVVVDDKGNATVTTPEGKTAVIPAADLTKDPESATKPNAGNDIVKPADKTVVANPEKLTDAEKKAIEDKVKAVNPDATVVVDDKGNATVTTPEGKTAVIPAADLTKDPESATKPNAGNDIVKPADKTVVANPEKLTDAEKKAIEDKVKAVNPDATVVVDDKGNATVTTPEGKTAVISAADLTKDPESATKPNTGNDIVKPADKTVVANPEKLTDAEKKAIEDKVKAVNPDATVVVDDKGNATVTPKDGEPVVIPSTDLTKDPESATKPNAGNDIVKPADKVVVDPAKGVDEAAKTAIADKVKAVNPGATVVVDDKGNATVTTPEGKTAVIPATDLTKSPADAAKANAGNAVNTPAAKVEVKDPAKLTDEEKAKVKEAIEAVNPGSKVVVDDKGNATVTTPEGDVVVIPATDLTKSPEDAAKANAGNAVNTPAAKVEVKDPAKLTDEEKAKVKKAIEAVNPGSKVVVDDKGNATVTTPEGKTATIPAADLTKSAADAGKANAGNAVNTPAAKVEVKDPANLTDAEKKAIEDKVKAVNPGSKVVVDDKGNVTVTTPEGKTATIPAADVTKSAADAGKANAGNGANTPATKTVVKDPAKLTDEEKAKVKKAVEDVNPGSTVVVNDKGDVIVTKGDGTVLVIPELDLVIPEDKLTDPTQQNGVNTPATRVLVGDKAKLTADEIEKVKESIKAVNPGSTVVVDDKGNATVTTPEGKTATIPAAQLVKDAKDVAAKNNGENINVDFEKETVADFNNLTDAEKAAAKAKIKGANADVVEVVFDKAGNATVITKDGKVYTIAAKDIFKQRPYVPSNGGDNNSGNGNGTSGNNGATNTDAKVDKAKLEGAIRQLDELIIKESAKLDAETAKEANALSADAKKVFANAEATQAEVDAMVKRIEGFMAKVASSTDHATPANDQAAQTPAVDSATTQAASNASQATSAQANARKGAKELPNTGTADSTVAMVAAAASALLGLGLAGRRRKEDEEA